MKLLAPAILVKMDLPGLQIQIRLNKVGLLFFSINFHGQGCLCSGQNSYRSGISIIA